MWHVAVTSHGHCTRSLILSQQQQHVPAPTVGPLPVVQGAPCLCVDQGCFKSTHLIFETRSSLLENLRLSCQALNSDARSLYTFEKSV